MADARYPLPRAAGPCDGFTYITHAPKYGEKGPPIPTCPHCGNEDEPCGECGWRAIYHGRKRPGAGLKGLAYLAAKFPTLPHPWRRR